MLSEGRLARRDEYASSAVVPLVIRLPRLRLRLVKESSARHPSVWSGLATSRKMEGDGSAVSLPRSVANSNFHPTRGHRGGWRGVDRGEKDTHCWSFTSQTVEKWPHLVV